MYKGEVYVTNNLITLFCTHPLDLHKVYVTNNLICTNIPFSTRRINRL